jgi:hypothetical protein
VTLPEGLHECERDLAKEGPCFGPRLPESERGPADRRVGGRWLCANHIVVIHGQEVYWGPADPCTPYRISPEGFYKGPVRVGDSAKVLFVPVLPGAMAEGMWVTVTKVDGDEVTGRLDNRPLDPDALHVNLGDVVMFHLRAIRTVQGGSAP